MTGSSVSEFLLRNQEPTPYCTSDILPFHRAAIGLSHGHFRRRKVPIDFPFDRADLLCDIGLLLVRKYRIYIMVIYLLISETWQYILITKSRNCSRQISELSQDKSILYLIIKKYLI